MLQIIISSETEERIKKRKSVLFQNKHDIGSSEIVFLDDMSSDIQSLEQYLSPSLFSSEIPVVHGKFLLEQYADQLNKNLLDLLIKSETFFLLEERSLSAVFLKTLEKSGAIVHNEKTTKTLSKKSNIFNVTNSLTSNSKKDRWISYRKALKEHAVEAIVGILYWKLRDLIDKSPNNTSFKDIYTSLMKAHKNAWQRGFSLELAIEKAILEQ